MIWYGKSDIGRVRSTNQDSFIACNLADDIVMCAVCDGMGGNAGGSEASHIALKVFHAEMAAYIEKSDPRSASESEIRQVLTEAVDKANDEVYKMASSDKSLSGMGTTLVAALIIDGKLYSINIGDSRMYIIRDGEAVQQTHDHSYVQYLVDIGKLTPAEARKSTNRNIITRAVGIDEKVEADINVACLSGDSGGYILLCSDGLTNFVENQEIAQIAEQTDQSLEQRVETLIALANERGGTDNITAVLLAF
ncbi:MAG: Stp1/IreP family PP2C-type Ser/Thr phosphatase [Clostridiales bacterium]|nr:Stp1/IreP family PP2C-type Ser/Thr phosphatase [Clostridiales bacterium]